MQENCKKVIFKSEIYNKDSNIKVTGSTSGYLKYHAMEQRPIIITLLCQFQEIVAMDWSLVVKANYDVAQHGLNLYFPKFRSTLI